MVSGMRRIYWGGVATGAGLALLFLYVLAQAISIDLSQWPRIVVGVVGLALFIVGVALRSRRLQAPAPSHLEGGAAQDERQTAG